MVAQGWEVVRTKTQLEEMKMEMERMEVIEMEIAFLASHPHRDFGWGGWWDPKTWVGHLSGNVSQLFPASPAVGEPVSLLSKPSSSFFWKLSSWKILEYYKASKYRRETIVTEEDEEQERALRGAKRWARGLVKPAWFQTHRIMAGIRSHTQLTL